MLILFLNSHKRVCIKYLVSALLLLIIYIFVCNNYHFYNKPIATITSVHTQLLTSSDKDYKSDSKTYKQNITAKVKNGDNKGLSINLTNIYDKSLVYTEKYHKGNDLFISIKFDNNNTPTGSIIKLKRDKYLVFMLLLLIFVLYIFCEKKGFLTILSVLINIVIFYVALCLYSKGYNILFLCIFASILFIIISLIIISGFNKKTLAAILSTLSSVTIITLLSALVILKNNKIDYEFMEFLYFAYEQLDANLIFISEILLCGLGAIMDISITMSSTVNELIYKNPHISIKDISKSCREIGYDITGTMINVMLFTNLGGCIPFFILSMKNGVSILSLLRYNAYFELTRFLTGSIAILLTIPLSASISIFILKNNLKLRNEVTK